MPVYDFGSASFVPDGRIANAVPPTVNPDYPSQPLGVGRSSDIEGGRRGPTVNPQSQPDYVEEFLSPGFRYLDSAIKNYWSSIRIPTKDSYRLLSVKVAGGEKSVLIWKDEIKEGRVSLPVASVNRLSAKYNQDKFSPPYLYMTTRLTGGPLTRVAKVFRPVPFIVDYELSVWTETKTDAEHVLHQILTRFHPLVTFQTHDEHIRGCVTMMSDGHVDNSDKEMQSDVRAKVRYDYRMSAEAWLSIPETVVPTILGRVASVKEYTGDVLKTFFGDLPGS